MAPLSSGYAPVSADDSTQLADPPINVFEIGDDEPSEEEDHRAAEPVVAPTTPEPPPSSDQPRGLINWRILPAIILIGVSCYLMGYAVGRTQHSSSHHKHHSDDTHQPKDGLLDQRIKAVVVLFFENRAFDTMLSWMDDEVEHKQNSLFVGNATASFNDSSPYLAPFDPNHAMWAQTFKLFGGFDDSAQSRADDYVKEQHGDSAQMCDYYAEWCAGNKSPSVDLSGFFAFEEGRFDGDPSNESEDARYVMSGFSKDELPVLSTLASEFAVFDRWFSAMPGPSWPNHMFAYSGTSMGCTDTGYLYLDQRWGLYPQKTIFQSLIEDGLEYDMIYNDTTSELYVEYFHTDEALSRTHNMSRFFHNAQHGTLPQLTWITPRHGVNVSAEDPAGVGPNSDHPHCCDVALGERLRKDVYEALRSSPQWNEVLLIITYDDAGGFFDSVPPPQGPPPDNTNYSYPDADFGFDRLGMRLPTIAVSPWLQKGLVISEPGQAPGCKDKPAGTKGCGKPYEDSQYESSSIAATVKQLFNLSSFLTKRDTWAGTFEAYFNVLDKARTDAPLTLPAAPAPQAENTHSQNTDDHGPPTRHLFEGGRDEDDDDLCDEPSRHQKRDIWLWEKIHNIDVPSDLSECANRLPHWKQRCPGVSRVQASEFLTNVTKNWIARVQGKH